MARQQTPSRPAGRSRSGPTPPAGPKPETQNQARSKPRAPRIVIAGGGPAGLSLAIALRQGLGGTAQITLVEAAQPPGQPDIRGWAITAGSRRLLDVIGAWQAMAADAAPVTEISVTDSRTRDVVRPVFLNFDQPRESGDPFAHIVMAGAMVMALQRTAHQAGVTFLDDAVTDLSVTAGGAEARLAGGESLACDLLVAADGARSRLRDMAGIGFVRWDYPQSGIVATLAHDRPHGGRAVEHFLPSGPFAMLPLTDDAQGRHRSSIVWTERRENIPPLLRLPPDMLLGEIEARFGLELGEIVLLDTPRAFPLAFGLARSFTGPRMALLGDAAHQVHPIAGQGMNLGLKDVAALAETIVDAARLGLDIGSATTLARYGQARRADTVAMGLGMDALNRLFSNDMLPLRLARDLGLGLVDRMPALKRAFMAQAAGEFGEQPRLLRGQAL